MTNARASRKRSTREQRLIDQRNSLIDVLNGILNTNLATHGKAEVFIPLSSTIGQKRFVVELKEVPEGVVLVQRRELLFDIEANSLLVVPNPDVLKV